MPPFFRRELLHFVIRLEEGLDQLASRAKQGKLKNRQEVERQIGRMLQRNSRAASLFETTVEETGKGKDERLRGHVKKKNARYE